MPYAFATPSVNIECDSISNYHRGRKYCIIKGVKTEASTIVSYERSLFSTMKTELLFDKCQLYAIPTGIFAAFPHLKTMYTWNSGLVTIQKKDFVNAVELRELDVSLNHVTLLEASTFFWAAELQYLNLASNRIGILRMLTFHGLIWLKVLHLDGNQIEHVWPGTFDETPRLEMLYLDHNRIRVIDQKLFVRNVGLMEVHMHCNNITRLDGLVVAHLKKLISFRANDNPVIGLDRIQVDSVYTNIRNTGCAGCVIGNRTEKLLASHNQISYIVLDTVSPKITELELNSNNLTSFQNITQLTQLNVLDISDNRIHDIGINSFAHLAHLSMLRLRQCGLSSINFGLFSYKPRLRLLDISNNRLGHVELIMFTGLKNVRYLYLEGNNIVRMDMSSIRQYFPILNTIGLSQNLWNCTNLAMAIKVLEANQIELNSEGLVKNVTNIKGIPCTSRDWSKEDTIEIVPVGPEVTTTLIYDKEDIEPTLFELPTTIGSQFQETTSSKPPIRFTSSAADDHPSRQTTILRSDPENTSDIQLLVKLVEMRVQVNAVAARIVSMSKTLHEMLELVSNKE